MTIAVACFYVDKHFANSSLDLVLLLYVPSQQLLIWVCTVCLDLFGSVRNIRTFTVLSFQLLVCLPSRSGLMEEYATARLY